MFTAHHRAKGLVICFPHLSAKIELLPTKPILAGDSGDWIDMGLIVRVHFSRASFTATPPNIVPAIPFITRARSGDTRPDLLEAAINPTLKYTM